jgi:4-aminobutyrate aminotransferase-like enzyme
VKRGQVLRRELAQAFSNGMDYFATCGGCTAAGAAGLAVMRVLASEGLQARAAATGAHLMARLRALQQVRRDARSREGAAALLLLVGA